MGIGRVFFCCLGGCLAPFGDGYVLFKTLFYSLIIDFRALGVLNKNFGPQHKKKVSQCPKQIKPRPLQAAF